VEDAELEEGDIRLLLQLQELNRNLENRAQERTEELEVANGELLDTNDQLTAGMA
jgi:hypothetical protein